MRILWISVSHMLGILKSRWEALEQDGVGRRTVVKDVKNERQAKLDLVRWYIVRNEGAITVEKSRTVLYCQASEAEETQGV